MKTSFIIVSLFFIFCLCGFSCQKEIMPPVTTTGAGTMGFKVDGVKWVAYSDDFKLPKTGAKYWTSYGLVIYGVSQKSHLDIILKNPKIGTYQFTSDDLIEYKLYNSATVFSLDLTDSSNILKITRSDISVISGTFSFKLKSSNGEIVSITSGRFDISINP